VSSVGPDGDSGKYMECVSYSGCNNHCSDVMTDITEDDKGESMDIDELHLSPHIPLPSDPPHSKKRKYVEVYVEVVPWSVKRWQLLAEVWP